MKERFDLLVFDWDGTLADSIDWIVQSLHYAASQCDCDPPSQEQSRAIIGLGLSEALAQLFPDATPQTLTHMCTAYSEHYRSRPDAGYALFDGVEAMLERLKNNGYTLAIATGKSRAGLRSALNSTAVGHYFSATRCADEGASKPNPAMLHWLMNETGTAPERTLMIGDTTHDLLMAQKAAVASIAVTCGAHPEHQLEPLTPLVCLRQTVELEALLLKQDR